MGSAPGQRLLWDAQASIQADAHFVTDISQLYPGLPVAANGRCGRWYAPSAGLTCCFSSRCNCSGDFGSPSLLPPFSSNIELARLAAGRGGALVVDAACDGRLFPDSLSLAAPAWAAVINRAVARVRARDAKRAYAATAGTDSSSWEGEECDGDGSFGARRVINSVVDEQTCVPDTPNAQEGISTDTPALLSHAQPAEGKPANTLPAAAAGDGSRGGSAAATPEQRRPQARRDSSAQPPPSPQVSLFDWRSGSACASPAAAGAAPAPSAPAGSSCTQQCSSQRRSPLPPRQRRAVRGNGGADWRLELMSSRSVQVVDAWRLPLGNLDCSHFAALFPVASAGTQDTADAGFAFSPPQQPTPRQPTEPPCWHVSPAADRPLSFSSWDRPHEAPLLMGAATAFAPPVGTNTASSEAFAAYEAACAPEPPPQLAAVVINGKHHEPGEAASILEIWRSADLEDLGDLPPISELRPACITVCAAATDGDDASGTNLLAWGEQQEEGEDGTSGGDDTEWGSASSGGSASSEGFGSGGSRATWGSGGSPKGDGCCWSHHHAMAVLPTSADWDEMRTWDEDSALFDEEAFGSGGGASSALLGSCNCLGDGCGNTSWPGCGGASGSTAGFCFGGSSDSGEDDAIWWPHHQAEEGSSASLEPPTTPLQPGPPATVLLHPQAPGVVEWDTELHLPLWVSPAERTALQSRIDGWVDRLLASGVQMRPIAQALTKPLRPLWISQDSRIFTNMVAAPSELPFTPLILVTTSQPRDAGRTLWRPATAAAATTAMCDNSSPAAPAGVGLTRKQRHSGAHIAKIEAAPNKAWPFVYRPGAGAMERLWAPRGLTPSLAAAFGRERLLAAGPAGIGPLVRQLLAPRALGSAAAVPLCFAPAPHTPTLLPPTLCGSSPAALNRSASSDTNAC